MKSWLFQNVAGLFGLRLTTASLFFNFFFNCMLQNLLIAFAGTRVPLSSERSFSLQKRSVRYENTNKRCTRSLE